MSLKAPNLDTRSFKDLVKEARSRIPRYTPDWTNLNDSDPGMALVKLNAWLTETLLYQVNRLPELNYIKFLDLLNVKPEPATAAATELSFTLKKLDNPTDPLVVLIPKGAQVAVDDPDLTQEVVFETDYTLRAVNMAVAAIIVQRDATDGGQTHQLITEYDEKEASLKVLHSFYPFGNAPEVGACCLIGLLLRPQRKKSADYSQDVFPAGKLDIAVNATEVFEKDENGGLITGPFAETSRFDWEVAAQAAALEWEIYIGPDPEAAFKDFSGNGNGWQRLSLSGSGAGLQDSGHVFLDIPENVSSVSLHQLPRDFWKDLGLKKPPVTIEDLIADLQAADLDLTADMLDEDAWQNIGVPEAELGGLMSCCASVTEVNDYLTDLKDRVSLDPTKVAKTQKGARDFWVALEAGYDAPQVPPYALAWLRVRVVNSSPAPALINTFLLNTVPATAAVTRLEEQLGVSDGRPARHFSLTRTPIYYDPNSGEPDLELAVVESGRSSSWNRVNDFYRQESDSEVFLLDESSGTITFGDGVHGRIPVAGAQIIARRYRYGGGALGNVGSGTVTKLKSVLPSVDSVTNLRGAVGGKDAEPLEKTKQRAAHELRTRDRAISTEDFALLAKQTPGVAIQRAYALARRGLTAAGETEERDGAVTLVILPFNDQDTPQPSEALLRQVCEHLNPRRLITTDLYVTGPHYKTIKSLKAEIRVDAEADLKEVSDACSESLRRYFHPLYGGDDGAGWPFGEAIYHGNVYQLLLNVNGVRRVVSLAINLEESATGTTCTDAIEIPEGYLVHLPQSGAVDLKVVYDSYR